MLTKTKGVAINSMIFYTIRLHWHHH